MALLDLSLSIMSSAVHGFRDFSGCSGDGGPGAFIITAGATIQPFFNLITAAADSIFSGGANLLLPPATKLGQGNIFRGVYQEFCSHPGAVHAGRYGQLEQAGGTHPTGMHTCLIKCSETMHENEENWTRGGVRQKFYYVDPPLYWKEATPKAMSCKTSLICGARFAKNMNYYNFCECESLFSRKWYVIN